MVTIKGDSPKIHNKIENQQNNKSVNNNNTSPINNSSNNVNNKEKKRSQNNNNNNNNNNNTNNNNFVIDKNSIAQLKNNNKNLNHNNIINDNNNFYKSKNNINNNNNNNGSVSDDELLKEKINLAKFLIKKLYEIEQNKIDQFQHIVDYFLYFKKLNVSIPTTHHQLCETISDLQVLQESLLNQLLGVNAGNESDDEKELLESMNNLQLNEKKNKQPKLQAPKISNTPYKPPYQISIPEINLISTPQKPKNQISQSNSPNIQSPYVTPKTKHFASKNYKKNQTTEVTYVLNGVVGVPDKIEDLDDFIQSIQSVTGKPNEIP